MPSATAAHQVVGGLFCSADALCTITSHKTFPNPSSLVNLGVKSLLPSLFLGYSELK